MDPSSGSETFFSEFLYKCSSSILCFCPMTCVLIVFYLFPESSNFSFGVLPFFFGLSEEFTILDSSICHDLSNFGLNFNFSFFIISQFSLSLFYSRIEHFIDKSLSFFIFKLRIESRQRRTKLISWSIFLLFFLPLNICKLSINI